MPDAKDQIDPGLTHASLSSVRWNIADTLLLAALSLLALGLRLLAVEQWSFGVIEAETFRALTQPLSGGPDSFMASDQSSYPVVFWLLRWLLNWVLTWLLRRLSSGLCRRLNRRLSRGKSARLRRRLIRRLQGGLRRRMV